MRRVPACAAASFALMQAVPGAAQDWSELTFGGEVFDVTGAGELDLGIIDNALGRYRGAFSRGRQRLIGEVTIDPNGAVIGCRFEADPALEVAAKALCAQALGQGQFRQDPILELDYSRATYRFVISGHAGEPVKGEALFQLRPAYPLERNTITFGSYAIPAEAERLTLADLERQMMSYPRDALRNAIEAEVVVAVTFDAEGRAARCRPVRSSNTARIAYDTCFEARLGFRLRNAPDPRPYVWITQWRLSD